MAAKTLNAIYSDSGAGNLSWETFHENSKTSRYARMLPDEMIVAHMARLWESLPFDRYPAVELPASFTPLKLSLEEAITSRKTARGMAPCRLTLANVGTIFHHAYGVTRDYQQQGFPRPFRTVPSGGALYPLELFFYATHVEGLGAGVYHYNASRHNLRFVQPGDQTEQIANGLVQQHLAGDAAMIIFITAMFQRSVFKYGDRGYRFVLLEAGHVAQNITLVATALGLGCVNVGGYFDRQIDDLLGLDGLEHSTIYVAAIGGQTATATPPQLQPQNGEHGHSQL
jgi:SagB-type dehydrogenase family enzyme